MIEVSTREHLTTEGVTTHVQLAVPLQIASREIPCTIYITAGQAWDLAAQLMFTAARLDPQLTED